MASESSSLLPEASAKLLEQEISNALEAVRRSPSNLIQLTDLPTPWRYNLHVIKGYRFTESWTYCLRSIFHFSNESFNIWSHLLGSLFLISILFDGPPTFSSSPVRSPTLPSDGLPPLPSSDGLPTFSQPPSGADDALFVWVYYAYIAAAIICTSCSVSWHAMRCIADHDAMSCFSSIDLMGVTTLVIASVLTTQFVAFADSAFWQTVYMSVSLVLGTLGLTISWLPLMRHPKLSWTRVFVWGSLVVQGLAIPIIHLLCTRGLWKTLDIYGPVIPAYIPIALGAIIYATQFPECCWPGRFDYLGSSHNIWHVASLYGMWLGIGALRNLFQTVE